MKLGLCIVLSGILHLPLLQTEQEPETVTLYMLDPRERVEQGTSMRLDGFLGQQQLAREQAIEAARFNGLIPVDSPAPRSLYFEWASVAGGLAPHVVRRFVLFHTHDIAGCNHAHLDLMMTVDFDIRPDGTVGVANGDTCVVNAIRRIVFPRSQEATRVNYPMRYAMISTDVAVLVR